MPLKKRSKYNNVAYLFLLPFLAVYGLFNIYPLIQGFILSFYKWNMSSAREFTGFGNYKLIFSDKAFWSAMKHTFLYVLISTPIFMLGAFIFALIINSKLLKGRTFVRSVLFLPNILAVSIVAVVWLNMLAPYTGLINAVCHSLGIEKELLWTTDAKLVWPAIVAITFWWNTGYYMILYLAGLQEIPTEQFEAAKLDGANWFQEVIHLTFPCLKNTHLMIMFLQMVASFKIFGQVFLVTEGGPYGTSKTIIQYIYEAGFVKFQVGKATAAAFVLTLVILIVSILQLQIMSRNRE